MSLLLPQVSAETTLPYTDFRLPALSLAESESHHDYFAAGNDVASSPPSSSAGLTTPSTTLTSISATSSNRTSKHLLTNASGTPPSFCRLGTGKFSAGTEDLEFRAGPLDPTPRIVSFKDARAAFLAANPKFASTEATTGRFLRKEFEALLDPLRTYADYGGGGQPMASVLRDTYAFARSTILGNPHSENESSMRSSALERKARHSVARFLDMRPESDELIWTANASAALGLIRTHYFARVRQDQVRTTVVLSDDMHNSVNGIRTVVNTDPLLRSLVRVVIVPVNIRTLRIDEDLFWNAVHQLKEDERGLVVLTAQSNLSGVKQPFSPLLRHAKARGWDTVLDAAALLPTTPFHLSAHPEVDAMPISWYKLVGKPEFGALVARKHFLEHRMAKTHFSGGTVSFVLNEEHVSGGGGGGGGGDGGGDSSFGLLEGAERFQDGTIPYAAMPQLHLALERLMALPRLRSDVQTRVQALTHWLARELALLRWPSTQHPLVRIAAAAHRLALPALRPGGEEHECGHGHGHGHGGTLGLVFYDATGARIPYSDVFARLTRFRIDLRHGCMCNTVASIANPGVGMALSASPLAGWEWRWSATRDSWVLCTNEVNMEDGTVRTSVGDQGVVRVSLGMPSTFEDVFRILASVDL
ncbi:hypothetical protein OC834_004880 [Tilletia horrida]|nr:hypothetical protein OC834_004880 [Tilletia horrida]